MCTPSSLASVAASVVEPGDTVPSNVTFLVQLLGDIHANPISRGRVMVDLLNEPDARGLRWTGSTPDMTTLYLAVMDTLYTARTPAPVF
ncbi:hypothetical protein WJX81_005272 [Elliptochloris bilobata]|uniref:Uncharacterized protein n=1 Tax=Elliptochloris bilobata TaxID=381761 RepID=A0AAW1QMZ3_9CHLO